MSCAHCGRRAKGRLCRDCEHEQRAEEQAEQLTREAETDGGVSVTACPECDSCELRHRETYPRPVRWACKHCGHTFEAPTERPSKQGERSDLRADGGDPGLTLVEHRLLTILAGESRKRGALKSELEARRGRPIADQPFGTALSALRRADLVREGDDGTQVITTAGRHAVYTELAWAFEHVHPTNVMQWMDSVPDAVADAADGGGR